MGIDYFKCDADVVIVMLVAPNFLMVKMAGRSFGRKQHYGLTVTVLVDRVLGERGGSASRVELFQQRKPSPQFFSEKEGGGGRGIVI